MWGLTPYDNNAQINAYKAQYGITNPCAGTQGGGPAAKDVVISGQNFIGYPTYCVICPDGTMFFDVCWPPTVNCFDQYFEQCGPPPLTANFTSDVTEVQAGGCVNFTDVSVGEVTSRTWTFDGGTPSTSNEENPTIDYNTPGVYTVSLTVTGPSGSSTETKTDYITVTAPPTTQNISLNNGFQFVSSNLIQSDPDMLNVLADILNENLIYVRSSNGSVFRKIGPNWVNGIGDWVGAEGYLFKMAASEELIIEGIPVDPQSPINIEIGYQFISYYPQTSMNAMDAFANILTDNLDFIRNSQGQLLRKIGPNWVNGIGDCEPGQGYLIKMFEEDILIYPAE